MAVIGFDNYKFYLYNYFDIYIENDIYFSEVFEFWQQGVSSEVS